MPSVVVALAVAGAVVAAGPRARSRLGAALRRAPAPARWRAVLARRRSRGSSPPGPLRVAQVCAEVAALLRAGAGPAAAWAQQGPEDSPALAGARPGAPTGARGLEAALARVGQVARGGGDVGAALVSTGHELPTHQGGAALAALAAAWRLAERTGAPAADVLDRVAAGLRADADAEDARAAALAAPRATARVLLALPLAGLLLGTAIGVDPWGVLLTTAPGRVCAAAGILLTGAAWAWTRALLGAARRTP